MSTQLAIDFVRHALTLTLLISGPMLITALLVGVGVSLLQAVTQIQEQTLTFIPKMLLVGLVLLLTLPWTLSQLIEYLGGILRTLPTLVG